MKESHGSILTPEQEPQELQPDQGIIWNEGFESARRIIAKSGNIALATEKGLRERNEDALVLDVAHDAFAVVDGMGGYDKGDVAARVVAEEIKNDFTHPEFDPKNLHILAQRRMRAQGVREGGAAYLAGRIERNGKKLAVCLAGDCGLIVVDRNTGAIKFKSKATSLEYAPSGPRIGRAEITRGIELKNYDRIVAATDGLWDNALAQEVAKVTVQSIKIEDALRMLKDLAIKGMTVEFGEGSYGNPDNVTIMIYEILPVPLRGK